MVAERLLMGSLGNQKGTNMTQSQTANTPSPAPPPQRPAGEQAIGTELYALIRQAIAELKG